MYVIIVTCRSTCSDVPTINLEYMYNVYGATLPMPSSYALRTGKKVVPQLLYKHILVRLLILGKVQGKGDLDNQAK